MAEHKKNSDLHSEENMPAKVRPPVEPKKEIATIQVRWNSDIFFQDPIFKIRYSPMFYV